MHIFMFTCTLLHVLFCITPRIMPGCDPDVEGCCRCCTVLAFQLRATKDIKPMTKSEEGHIFFSARYLHMLYLR